MGSFLSKRSEQSSHNKVHQSAVHIINLLSDLNSKCTDTGDDCTLVETRYVDTANLHRSLERYEDTPIFKEYQVAEMIKSLPPVSASLRRNKKKTYSYETTTYFDVYGAEPGGSKHKKINKIISKHVTGNSDIVNIILEYRGNEIFLFTAKTVDSGGGTLSSLDLTIGDALTAHTTVSEKSGTSSNCRANKIYGISLLLYLAWIVAEVRVVSDYRWGSSLFGSYLTVSFDNFVKYEIRGERRPPPRERVCIYGDCKILTECGARRARDICAGDLVQLSDGSLVKVECSLTQRIEAEMEMCLIGQCWVTTEHPVRIGNGGWVIPKDIMEPEMVFVDQINNFVLERGHHVMVDGVECITLGHMMDEPQQLYHAIWGTNVIREFLKTLPGYPNVVVTAEALIKLMQHDSGVAL